MKDLFSAQADLYARYRPVYPPEVFEYIFALTDERQLAWDAGTGNGQMALELAKKFDKVYATDISSQQLSYAALGDNITYAHEAAEKCSLADASANLVTVAQALHWFRHNDFFKELKRVLKPGGVFVASTYNLFETGTEIDSLIHHFYTEVIGSYWHPERRFVDTGYKNIEMPLKEIKAPDYTMSCHWTFDELMGYLNTWSAVKTFIELNDYNPVDELATAIRPYWKYDSLKINFPLTLRVGKNE